MKGIKSYANALKLGGLISIMTVYNACKNEPAKIIGVGVPKGYHIENVKLPTQGTVDTVWFLSGEQYKIVHPSKNKKSYEGNFKYHIKPSIWFTPQDPYHSDVHGHTPDNNSYWYDTREGKVEIQKNTAKNSIENKLKD